MYIPEKKARPPYQQKWTLYKRWQVFATLGLLLTGFGLCLVTEASYQMHSGVPATRWLLLGTISLIIFNGGLAFFGEAVKCRTKYEIRKALKRHLKKQIKTKNKATPKPGNE